MYAFLMVIHLLVCVSLVAVVLVQSGKGGGLAGGAFGGSAQTVFGGRGATDFITRATMVLGVAFFLTSLTLALLSTSTGQSKSLMQEAARKAAATAPATLPSGTAPGGTQRSTTPLVPPAATPAPAKPGGGP
jgi:preprotein translocase subunit SecG